MGFKTAGSKRTNYAYAVARVQAKRSKLIPPSEYEKILQMDVPEITRYVQDSVYKNEVDELSSRFAGLDLLEAALTVNQERTHQAIRQMVDGEGGALVRLFLGRHLVEDIKTVLRGKNAGASKEELLKELLLEDLDTFNVFQPLLADDVKTPEDVVAALSRQGGVGASWARVLASVPADSGMAAYEDALDKALYGDLLNSLRESKQKGSDAMLEFVRREVDARNLMNAARWIGVDGDFSPYIIPGGKILKVRAIMDLSKSENLAALAEKMSELGLPEALVAGAKEAASTGRLANLQAAVHHWHMDDLGSLSHQNPLSIVPILLFLIRKNHEVRTLRAVARGKSAGLPTERLRELIA